MDPSISPWLVYAVGLVDAVKTASIFGIFICIFASIPAAMLGMVANSDAEEKVGHLLRTFVRWALPISVVLSLVLPSRNILIGMVGAQLATPHNIETVRDGVREELKYLINLVVEEEEQDNDE